MILLAGVSHVSVPELLLFNLFINDLFYIIKINICVSYMVNMCLGVLMAKFDY